MRARLAVTFLLVAACLPDVSDPAAFEKELEQLRDEWEGQCPDACALEVPPAACAELGPADECNAYDFGAAKSCLNAYKRVIRKEVCSASDADMTYLGERCSVVFSECGLGTSSGESGSGSGSSSGSSSSESSSGSTGANE